MKVLILALNYAPEPVGAAVYTAGLAEDLTEAGDDVHVVVGRPFYPHWRVDRSAKHRALENGVSVRRVWHYVPKTPSGGKRILHQFTFALFAFFPMLWRAVTWRPDVVLAIAPALVAAPVARLAAWGCGARSWLHVQDLEVDAALATGLIKSRIAQRLARALERRVLRSFHAVSSISPAMCQKLEASGVDRGPVCRLPNWADLEHIRPLGVVSPYRQEWRIGTPHVVLYSGSLAGKQGMNLVLEAARKLEARGDVTFVICGDGPARRRLEQEAESLAHVQIHPLQPRARLNDLLGLATLHLLPQIDGVSNAVLPSKLGNMLASGRPIVATAATGTALHAAVAGCGRIVPAGDLVRLVGAIEALLDHPEERRLAGTTARHRAEREWNKAAIIAEFRRVLCLHTKASVRAEEAVQP